MAGVHDSHCYRNLAKQVSCFRKLFVLLNFRSSSKGKGGNGAALSALTLLAFLFLINVMQQSLQDNNSTTTPTTTAILLRDTELPIILDNGESKDVKTKDEFSRVTSTYGSRTTTKDHMR
ncbi:PREDICTED: uncharacterized protein LOC106742703 [Dinoponera quadriceps]|uniref:Uncharacterized protein LOC106742703 n=1 Tax=Dinoponera quadriceps TaxID=609295 RepID=A0A6P3X0M5_DINQU|nr:PREDICTED: uncharacterized protein LOC106742703 [Dinoponera quadriceps]